MMRASNAGANVETSVGVPPASPELPELISRAWCPELIRAEPIHLRQLTLRVGASIGGAIGSSGCDGPETVLQQADAAMYRAKAAGIAYCLHQPSAAVAA